MLRALKTRLSQKYLSIIFVLCIKDEIPDEVFMVHGWDMNENMDEINIVESACFVTEAHANAELERMKIVQPRAEWIINRWRIDQAQWQEGFERGE